MRTAREIERENIPLEDLQDAEVIAMAEFYRNASRLALGSDIKADWATVANMYLLESIRRLLATREEREG